MFHAIADFFNSDEFMPHGHCFLWDPKILWLHVVSDAAIAIAYFSIPFALIYFVRRRADFPFKNIFWLFGAFILLCGTTHLISIWVLWYPEYAFEGIVKAVTAIASLWTFFIVARLIPVALDLVSPSQLATLNAELRQNIMERDRAQRDLHTAYQLMEKKVEERTGELKQNNERLLKLIHEREDIEKQLQKTMKELTQSNTELQRFASVCSHDLQEPARMVGSYAKLFEMKYKDTMDEDAKLFIHFMIDGAQRMQEMIRSILSYSRIGYMEKEYSDVDCNKIVANILHDMQGRINDTGAEVTCNTLPTIWGDAVQIAQLFQNLIGNALKFQKPGGKPKVHIRAERMEAEKSWRFAISDNGIGVHKNYTDKIFQIFQRLNRREEYPGSGIGLATCKKIVDSYGGRIWVENNESGGATFFFTLPDKSADQPNPKNS